jgi:glyoxylase-like metal-dependent hydrolase (beta-lactamase superfamily II)
MRVTDEEENFKSTKASSPFYRIDPDAYMIFHERSSVNFNSCNCYLLKDGNEITLIDPGCSQEGLVRTLEDANMEFRNISNILLTHAHSDHYGLVNFLRSHTKCEVYVHGKDREFLEDTTKYVDFLFERALLKNRPRFRDLYQILENFVNGSRRKTPISDSEINPVIEMIFNVWDIQSIAADHEFHDNETLPGNLGALHLPGHTPGHSAFKHLSKPFIFCGDIDFNVRGPVVSSTNANISDFKQSIRKLEQVIQGEHVSRLFPGHWHPVFSDLYDRLEAFGKKFDKKEEQILRILDGKCLTLDDVTTETFKDFITYFQEFIDDDTKDSLLVGEASELQTNRNYLVELEREKRVDKKSSGLQECWTRK